MARAAAGAADVPQDERPFDMTNGMIAADWSTDRLSLYLLSASGAIEDSRMNPETGTAALAERGARFFEDTLEQQIGAWEQSLPRATPPRPCLCSGASAANKSIFLLNPVAANTAPYATLPAGVKQLGGQAVRIPMRSGRVVFVVPGCISRSGSGNGDSVAAAVSQQDERLDKLQQKLPILPQPAVDLASSTAAATTEPALKGTSRSDYLRGEETRVMGALVSSVMNAQPGSMFHPRRVFCIVSSEWTKWIGTLDGCIQYFRTYTTPTVFAALMGSSLTATAAAEEASNGAGTTAHSNATLAAEMGLTEGLAAGGGMGDILHRLFYVTSEPQFGGQLSHADRPPLLAGMLVGAEARDAAALCRSVGGWSDQEQLVVTVMAANGSSGVGSQLLPVYKLALGRLAGCSVDDGNGGVVGDGLGEAQSETATGLFALANAVSVATKQNIEEKRLKRLAEAEMAAASSTCM